MHFRFSSLLSPHPLQPLLSYLSFHWLFILFRCLSFSLLHSFLTPPCTSKLIFLCFFFSSPFLDYFPSPCRALFNLYFSSHPFPLPFLPFSFLPSTSIPFLHLLIIITITIIILFFFYFFTLLTFHSIQCSLIISASPPLVYLSRFPASFSLSFLSPHLSNLSHALPPYFLLPQCLSSLFLLISLLYLLSIYLALLLQFLFLFFCLHSFSFECSIFVFSLFLLCFSFILPPPPLFSPPIFSRFFFPQVSSLRFFSRFILLFILTCFNLSLSLLFILPYSFTSYLSYAFLRHPLFLFYCFSSLCPRPLFSRLSTLF